MKIKFPMPIVGAIVALCASVPAHAQLRLPRPSPNAKVMQTIGLTDVTVTYSRPGVKGRAIWGELVPYDEPWRTGANEATSIVFSEDVTIQGKPLPAATYSFFTIPHEKSWTCVFNKEKDLWGAYAYKPEQDALRIEITPEAAEHEEWMRFTFENLATNSADLVLRWEKLKLSVPIRTNDLEQAMDSSRVAVATAKPDDWRTPFRAAGFLLDNSLDLALAAQWAQQSVKIEPGYLNLTTLARIQAKQGNPKDAIATAERAVKAGKESKEKTDTRPAERLIAEWSGAK